MRHSSVKILVLVVAFFLSEATAEEQGKGAASLRAQILLFESALDVAANDDFVTLTTLVSKSLFMGSGRAEQVMMATAKQHREFLGTFGGYSGLDSVGTIELGDSLVTSIVVWKMKEAATIWHFNFYNAGDEKWKLVSFGSEPMTSFLEQPEKVYLLSRMTRPSSK